MTVPFAVQITIAATAALRGDWLLLCKNCASEAPNSQTRDDALAPGHGPKCVGRKLRVRGPRCSAYTPQVSDCINRLQFLAISTEVHPASSITKNPVSPPPEVTLTTGELDRRTMAPQTLPRKRNGFVSTNIGCQFPVSLVEDRKHFPVQIERILHDVVG
jgi:hypothetical protein